MAAVAAAENRDHDVAAKFRLRFKQVEDTFEGNPKRPHMILPLRSKFKIQEFSAEHAVAHVCMHREVLTADGTLDGRRLPKRTNADQSGQPVVTDEGDKVYAMYPGDVRTMDNYLRKSAKNKGKQPLISK